MGRASIAYTNKDYDSLRRELLGKVPQLTDRWTDFRVGTTCRRPLAVKGCLGTPRQ